MHKNKATIIIYLLLVLVLVFPAINAIGERQVYARAKVEPNLQAYPGSNSAPETRSPAGESEGDVPATGAQNQPTAIVSLTAATTGTDRDPSTERPKTTLRATEVPDDPAETTTATLDEATSTPLPTSTPPAANVYTGPPSSEWKNWPVLPTSLSNELKELYRQGIAEGNNRHAFSVLGDCQSVPDVFMGIYDQDPDFVASLPENLQETIRHFGGSFERYAPTVKDGTTEGALLWYGWNDNLGGFCEHGETPLDCELRVHKPTIVFIHVGTHWEARNRDYLIRIITRIKEAKAIPVLVTKADNRELDERVNQTYADLAAEYNLPLWNFWASVQHLPENGMEPGSDMYLSEDGLVIHRDGALETLDAIWRMVEAE